MADLHVWPNNDQIEHLFEDCPCGPRDEPVKREDGSVGWIAVHHSLDGRERQEAAAPARRQHDPGALTEEPDLHDDDPFAAQRLADAEDPGDRLDADQPEDGGR